MSDPIEFYFDFSSPYGYLAAECIDDIAGRHGRGVAWRPYLMGVAMKVTGSSPIVNRPMLGEYSRRDMVRSARRLKVPFSFPEPFPIATIAACRAVYWSERAGAEEAKSLARALYRAYFADGRNISEADVVAVCLPLTPETRELFDARLEAATGQLGHTHKVKLLRREAARLQTIMRERELEIGTDSPGSGASDS